MHRPSQSTRSLQDFNAVRFKLRKGIRALAGRANQSASSYGRKIALDGHSLPDVAVGLFRAAALP